MRNHISKLTILITLFGLLCILSYPARYYYYLWRLHNWEHGNALMYVSESIERIGPHIKPLLVKTYNNTHAHPDERKVAAIVLSSVDRERAEKLFEKFLTNTDESIISEAIVDLGYIKSDKSFEKIVVYADSPNAELRKAVALYLGYGSFDNLRVRKILATLVRDQNDEVRDAAKYSLSGIALREKERRMRQTKQVKPATD